MYTEVRRHPELRGVFQGGQPFPILDKLRDLAAGQVGGDAGASPDDAMWFWITFALGLAQLSTLADATTFAATVAAFRRQFTTTPQAASEVCVTTGGQST